MKNFVRWSKTEYSFPSKLIALLLAGGLFLGLIPYALLRGLPGLEDRLGIPIMPSSPVVIIAGILLLIIGAPIGFGTVLTQIFKASGTPLPMFPTQKLLTGGLYTWSRNPMVFGTLTAYLGLSLLSASWSAVILTILFAVFLVLYVKLVEERELAARFGQPYLDYKKKTSFIIPWPPKRV